MTRMEVPPHYKYAAIPHIMLEGAADAIEFYADAFGASEIFRLGDDDGRIIHAEISVQGSTVMLGDVKGPFSAPGTDQASVALHVYVPDVDALTARAVAADAELLSCPADMPYGARQSMLRDPFGHVWIFLTPITA